MELENITVYLNDKILLQKYSYCNDKLHGPYKSYWKNGKIKKSCEYINGKLHGVYKEFYENSNLKIFCNYIDDNIIGVYKEFYSSANLKISCVYIKEGIHGEYYKYYDIDKNSNNMEELSYYMWGEKYGKSIEYYESGQVKIICNFSKDELDGEYTEFDENRNIIKERRYFRGEIEFEK